MNKSTAFAVLAIVWASFAPTTSLGLGVGGGDGGCCGFPPELAADAKALREQFQSTTEETLLDQQILGSLCESHICGKLTEEQASRLLDRSIAAVREGKQWWSELWAWVIAGAGLIIAAGGL